MSSDNLKRYIWETQIVPQLGYSFSTIHSTGYSLTALQMMNLAHHYPPVLWATACLMISARANEDNLNSKNSNYGRVASAIGKMKSHGTTITLPNINKSRYGFTPNLEDGSIVFGLKGIIGLGDEAVHSIIANRPYSSFEDFYERMYQAKQVQRSQMLQLIKAGCFNEFDTPVEIMKRFIVKEVDVKDKLNGQNIPRIIALGLFDNQDYKQYQDYYNFRAHLKKHVHEVIKSPKNRILILKDDYSKIFFENTFSGDSISGYANNGELLIDEKLFEKEYKKLMKPVTVLLEDTEFIRKFNIAQFHELWEQYANGAPGSAWYMEAVSFYPYEHELENVDVKRYGIVNFNELSESPIVLSEKEGKNGRIYQELQLYTLAGTVLDKNSNSHSITLLTKDGVATVKTYAGAYAHYDRQIKIDGKIAERSWFTRGALLLLQGYRRQDQFVLKAPKGQHTINKITEIRPDGSIGLQSERIRV